MHAIVSFRNHLLYNKLSVVVTVPLAIVSFRNHLLYNLILSKEAEP